MIGLDKEDKTMQSIIEEYKMSMGGSFFNNSLKRNLNMEAEHLMIKKGIENHLFNVHELLTVYDKLSEQGKRAFFQRIVLAFIELYSNTDK